MKKLYILVFCIFISAFISCNRGPRYNSEYYVATPNEFKELGDNININYEVIKLQDKENDALVSDIKKIIPFNGRLYVLSIYSGSVYIFNNTGKFLKKLIQGRGPEEFSRAMDILIDEHTGNLEVLSRTNVYCYDFEGNFLQKKDLPKANILGFEKVGEDYLIYTPHMSEQNKHYFRLYNCTTKTEERFLDGFDLPLVDIKPNIFKDVTGRVYFKGMYGDTVYTLDENKQCVAVTTLAPFLNEMPSGNFKRLSALAKSLGNEYALFCGVKNFGSRLWGMNVSGEKNYDIIYDSKTQTTYKNLFNSMPGIDCVGCYDGWWYYTIYPFRVSELKEISSGNDRLTPIITHLESLVGDNIEEGNPLIIMVKYEV